MCVRQALDVMLFTYIKVLDKKLSLTNLSTNKCGYISLTSGLAGEAGDRSSGGSLMLRQISS